MAGNISDYAANKILDLLRAQTFNAVAGYCALYTGSPGDDNSGSGSELADTGAYTRQALTIEVSAARSTANSGALTWSVATADWGTVSHIGILDTDTHGAGNLVWHGGLTSSKRIETDDQFKINDNDLDLSFTGT